ncbi:MAG: PDZ domain-containing protein [Verrucomicrobia bacterium]|nr:PDZ domain-containing protein [Verrucomicrobiota bacterium]
MKTLRFAIGLLVVVIGVGCWLASGNAGAAEGQRNATAGKRPPPSPRQQPPKWIGVNTEPIPDIVRSHLPKLLPEQGVMIQSVAKESPAAMVGLERSDIIVRADGQPVGNPQDFQAVLNRRNFGTQVRLDLIQKGIAKTAYCIVLENMNADGAAAAAAAHERNPFRGLKGDKVSIQFSCPDAEGNMQTISATKLDQLGQRAQQDEEFRVKLQRMFDGLQQNQQGVTIVIRPSQEPPAATNP